MIYSYNLAYALDFDGPPNPEAPSFDVPTGLFGSPCDLQSVLSSGDSTRDLEVARNSREVVKIIRHAGHRS